MCKMPGGGAYPPPGRAYCDAVLFAAQGLDGVLARSDAGGDETGDKRERHADGNQRRAADGRQNGVERLDAR